MSLKHFKLKINGDFNFLDLPGGFLMFLLFKIAIAFFFVFFLLPNLIANYGLGVGFILFLVVVAILEFLVSIPEKRKKRKQEKKKEQYYRAKMLALEQERNQLLRQQPLNKKPLPEFKYDQENKNSEKSKNS